MQIHRSAGSAAGPAALAAGSHRGVARRRLAAYTRAVEAAYRAMWTEFCNKPIPPA